MDIMSQFNLPSYTKGKSFSEASALIAKKFEGRTSPEDMETLNELQGRLQQAQEFVKAKQEEASKPQGGAPQHQMPDGSMMPGESHGQMDPSMPPQESQMQDPNAQAIQENMFKLGGSMKANTYADGGKFGALSKFLMDNEGILNKGVNSSNLNGLNAQQYIQNDRLGNMPETFGGNYADRPSRTGITDYQNSQFKNELPDMYRGIDELSNTSNMFTAQRPGFGGTYKTPYIAPGTSAEPEGMKGGEMSTPDMSGISSLGSGQSKTSTTTSTNTTTSDSDVDTKRNSKFNPAGLLRYAAPLSTAQQLLTQKKPEDVALSRINRKYDPQMVDERQLQNTVQNSAANSREALRNASGGSSASLSANLLASQLQTQKAQSGAYAQAAAENRNELRQKQQFDLGVDQVNMQQSNAETNMNLARKAGYETNRSRMMAQLGQDLSGIGQEELFKKYPELAGLGYDSKGRKIRK